VLRQLIIDIAVGVKSGNLEDRFVAARYRRWWDIPTSSHDGSRFVVATRWRVRHRQWSHVSIDMRTV
jgi:hypothetical protein